MSINAPLGATCLGDGRAGFLVWAPLAESVAVHIVEPVEQQVLLERGERGYYYGETAGTAPGSLYFYILDGHKERPDPASRLQPRGVHGPSQLVGPPVFSWTDKCWFGLARQDLVFYELHVGTFTPGGTFDDIIPHLEGLRELGVTAVELMPVAQFAGSRNWGYDGVFPFAVQCTYGGPEGLKRLVDACHALGLAVFLDVVYNHLGPEGNYLGDFGPYFTNRYRTPWGAAINYDGAHSDEVRRFFIENALYWLREFHMDGLRLDAIHAITDKSARPFLEELSTAAHREADRLGRRVHVIGESDLNDVRVFRPRVAGGSGLDGQWSDDFHHALHALLTGERTGYYQDFGSLENLARAFRDGFVYTGQYSLYRQRRHGFPPGPPDEGSRFVVYAQNHDQTGNRERSERLSSLVSFDGLKLAAVTVLLSPFLPLIFMGEEYGETAPFRYFTSFSDPELAVTVLKGRLEEFSAFGWQSGVYDPQDEAAFNQSRLNHELSRKGYHRVLRELYQLLLQLRRELPALAEPDRDNLEVTSYDREMVLLVRRRQGESQACIILCFSDAPLEINLPLPAGHWLKRLDTGEEQWLSGGSKVPATLESLGEVKLELSPRSGVLFERLKEAGVESEGGQG